jgi:hypothetical protein
MSLYAQKPGQTRIFLCAKGNFHLEFQEVSILHPSTGQGWAYRVAGVKAAGQIRINILIFNRFQLVFGADDTGEAFEESWLRESDAAHTAEETKRWSYLSY